MKIKVSNITPEGEYCKEIYNPETLDINRFDIKILRPFEVDYYISREGEELFVDAKVKMSFEIVCARCLERVEKFLEKDYKIKYRVKDMDIIDPKERIREEIILDYPLKPLCKPDCLGLCPKCGKNLNMGKCSCEI